MPFHVASPATAPRSIRRRGGRCLTIVLALIAFGSFASRPQALGDDWPQWMGPKRDGVWRETGLVRAIPQKGLPVQWRAEVKGG